ncbi:hypothetical protein OAU25_00985 [Crocinitomicaceae bacterium]|nr:hypothetical protein [Crocinitomicaceae bacterium]
MKFIVLIIATALAMFLGYKLRKSSKKENNERFYIYGGLTFLFALAAGISAISLMLLKGDAWSIENKMTFKYILYGAFGLIFLVLGVKLLLKARKEKNTIGQLTGLLWVAATVFVFGMLISRNSKMNDGWTSERQSNLMSSCEGMADQGMAYNCPCFVREVMEKFPDPEDYNKAMENESNGKKEELLNAMDEECPCGVASYDESEIESIDIPI